MEEKKTNKFVEWLKNHKTAVLTTVGTVLGFAAGTIAGIAVCNYEPKCEVEAITESVEEIQQ